MCERARERDRDSEREREREGSKRNRREIMKKRSNEEDEETQREQRTDECIVGGTHQLNRTIMFPAEVSTPAAQVLRGRAVTTQTHGQTHGLSVLHHTTQTSIN